MSGIQIDFDIQIDEIVNQVNSIIDDTYVRVAVHRLLAEMTEKYLPYDTGVLNNSVRYTQDAVIYEGIPYAHYVYEGIVYGPNYKYIDKDGNERWYSIPGMTKQPKEPTQLMKYKKSTHPDATGHWDRVMLENDGDEFVDRILQIIQRRQSKING